MANEKRQRVRRSTRRLVALLALPITLVIVGCMVVLFIGVLRNSQDTTEQEVEGVLTAVAYTFEPSTPRTSVDLQSLAEAKAYERLWVLNSGGIVVASSAGEEIGEPPGPQWASWVQEATDTYQGDVISYGGGQLLVGTIRNATSGHIILALVPVIDVGFFNDALLWVLGVAITMWMGAVGFLYTIVVSRIRAPLVAVASTLEKARQGTDIPVETENRLVAQSAAISESLVTEAFSLAKKYKRSKFRFQGTVEQFRKLLDLTPLSISIFSDEGKLIEANATFYKNLELPLPAKRADPGMPIAPHIPMQQIMTLGARSLKERCTFSNVEASFVNARKQQVPTRIHVQAVQTEGRSVYFVVAENRAEQKQLHSKLSDFSDAFSLRVEEQTAGLRQSVQRLETFISEADILFAAFDKAQKTLFWNKTVAQRAGSIAPHMVTLQRFVRALVHAPTERETMMDWLAGGAPSITIFKTSTHKTDWILHWTQAKDAEGNLILTGLPVHLPKALPAVSPSPKRPAKPVLDRGESRATRTEPTPSTTRTTPKRAARDTTPPASSAPVKSTEVQEPSAEAPKLATADAKPSQPVGTSHPEPPPEVVPKPQTAKPKRSSPKPLAAPEPPKVTTPTDRPRAASIETTQAVSHAPAKPISPERPKASRPQQPAETPQAKHTSSRSVETPDLTERVVSTDTPRKRSPLDSLVDLDLGDSWDDDFFLDEELGGGLDVEPSLGRDSSLTSDHAEGKPDDDDSASERASAH